MHRGQDHLDSQNNSGNEDHANNALQPSSVNVNMQGQPRLGALADEQIQEDGFIMLSNQINQGISGQGDGAHKPEFGPQASKILAPMV